MAQRTHRTDTGFFIAVVVIIIGGFIWASQYRSSTGSALLNPDTTSSAKPVTSQSTAPANVTWNGELILVRENTVIARKSDGSERMIYTAASGATINRATAPASGTIFIELATGTASQVVSVKLVDGTVADSRAPNLATAWPRPTGGSYANVVSSNAERDFGSTVNLVDGNSTTKMVQSPSSISALAWRTDGEVLAITNQTSLIIVTLVAGDTQTVTLPAPAASLSWRGSDIIVLTPVGPYILAGGSQELIKLNLEFTVGHDLVALTDQQYAWLTSATGDGQLQVQTIGQSAVSLQATAKNVLGLAN